MSAPAAAETLPSWRRNHRSVSPDGRHVARVDPAWETAMGGPTSGTLWISIGLHVPDCSPAFLWSDDSRYLAVARFFQHRVFFKRQRMLVVDLAGKRVHESLEVALLMQPESFAGGRLAATLEPDRARRPLAWNLPADLAHAFRRDPMVPWPELPPEECAK